MNIDIVCSNLDFSPEMRGVSQEERSTGWVLPLEREQLDFLLNQRGMFVPNVVKADLQVTIYRIPLLCVLVTVLQSHIRKQPWLTALMDVLNTDPDFKNDWCLRVSEHDEGYIDELIAGQLEQPSLALTDVAQPAVESLKGGCATVDYTRNIEIDIESRQDLFDLDVLPKTPDREPEDISELEIDDALSYIGE